ncbi:MAG: hypothetical protein D6698_13025 [Gammaproteobacteria bacterium]|nr:MAG: hypothetical protein D6698_13025 [Gammaproteobacteria bacterium]
MNRHLSLVRYLTAAILLSWFGSAQGSVTIYTDETAYLQALKSLEIFIVSEGFEDEFIWKSSRGTPISPGRAQSVTSQHLVWTSNQKNHGVGTDHYFAQGGSSYRFYSNPHGRQFDRNMQRGCDQHSDHGRVPDPCWQNDGWRIVPAQQGMTLYGIGGWFYSASGRAKITYLLDGKDIIPNNSGRDGHRIHTDWTFLGVIDTAGFHKVEIREMAGKASEPQYVYGDSFSIGLSHQEETTPGSTDSKLRTGQSVRE